MAARLDHHWAYRGLEAWILENARLRVTVLPELGGHVFELIDKAADRDLLWHNPRTPPRRAPFGAHFDDWWSGGWDEIFPTGDVARLHGEPLPYMGELWSVPWTVAGSEVSTVADATPGAAEATSGAAAATRGAVALSTTGLGTIAPARLERTLELRDDEPVLRVRYRLTNLDVRRLPFLWGIHPCFAVGPDHRIDLPASRMHVGVSSGPSMGEVGVEYQWPDQPDPTAASGSRDVRCVLSASASAFGGHWATDLAEGWLALTDTASRRGVALAFPLDVFPHAWLWQVYGGWRGHHHLCLEPWTGHPMQLEEAEAAGRARSLEPGESLESDLAFVLFDGRDHVESVERRADGYTVR